MTHWTNKCCYYIRCSTSVKRWKPLWQPLWQPAPSVIRDKVCSDKQPCNDRVLNIIFLQQPSDWLSDSEDNLSLARAQVISPCYHIHTWKSGPFIHLGNLWSSQSSSPWSWRSPRHSSMSHTPGPSSSQWWNSSGLCLYSICPNNHLTQHGFPEQIPLATNRQTPQKIPSWAGQTRSQTPWWYTILWVVPGSG